MGKIDLKEYLERLEEPEDREAVANRDYQRELFLEYVVRDSNFPERRAELLRDFKAGQELTGPKGLRRKLGAIDLEYFGRAYLAHYFVRKSPAFHGELDRIWREGVLKGLDPTVAAKEISRADGCRRAIEAPRGHAKSTTFTFKDSIHAAVYAYKHYEIILSDSSEQAEGFLADIKTEFEENAALREDFGELEGKVWKSSVILTANGVKIEAIGSGKKIRGRRHKQWRPDLIVCDDLENDENVNTPEQRKKLRDWFYKAVSKAGDTYTDIVYIGTLLHFDALLANVAKNPSYKAVKYRGFYPMGDRVVCRSVPMQFKFMNNNRIFTEDVTFTFSPDKKIESVAFGLGNAARRDIFKQGGDVWGDSIKMVIVTFLENYKTAFALKRLDYIKSIFDENAYIIVGHKLQKLQAYNDKGGFSVGTQYEFQRKTKEEYITQLEKCFKRNEYVNINFSDNDIQKAAFGGNTFGIQIKQDYYSQHYGDQGYLFLFVDLNEADKPIIKIRTWQPERNGDITPMIPKSSRDYGIYGIYSFE